VIRSTPQLGDLLTSEDVTIADLSDTYDSAERIDKVAHMLNQLEYFQFQKDSDKLRLRIVVQEAHLWASRYLPLDAVRFLNKEVRMLRKEGVGVMLFSHKISDLNSGMKSAMDNRVFFGTKCEGDLDAIGKVLGSDY